MNHHLKQSAPFRFGRFTAVTEKGRNMATYDTEIHTGGGGWQSDEPLTLSIANRGQVVPDEGAPPTGTTVTWNSPEAGAGSVTFFDGGSRFEGTAQFPGEGPVGYRGTLST